MSTGVRSGDFRAKLHPPRPNDLHAVAGPKGGILSVLALKIAARHKLFFAAAAFPIVSASAQLLAVAL